MNVRQYAKIEIEISFDPEKEDIHPLFIPWRDMLEDGNIRVIQVACDGELAYPDEEEA
jgi:hypothetical protein